MKACVTGATGFVGAHVVRALAERGDDVRVIYRNPGRLNARGPEIAVQAAAAAGVSRVVVTSTISAIGVANGNGPADEETSYPADWLGLAYPDSKHAGETAAIDAADRHGPGSATSSGARTCPGRG
jgi:nucleoside-diphosphate-sugar epimerase